MCEFVMLFLVLKYKKVLLYLMIHILVKIHFHHIVDYKDYFLYVNYILSCKNSDLQKSKLTI